MSIRDQVLPNLQALGTNVEKGTNELVDFAVTVLLDTMDHTNFYYDLIDSSGLIEQLVNRGFTDPRLRLMNCIHTALKSHICDECGGIDFNYECPVIICNKCTEEYIIVCEASLSVCNMCPASDLNTCIQHKRLKIEIDMEGVPNGHNYVIIKSGKTTVPKSSGNLEFYSDRAVESEEGELDGVRETYTGERGQVYSIQAACREDRDIERLVEDTEYEDVNRERTEPEIGP